METKFPPAYHDLWCYALDLGAGHYPLEEKGHSLKQIANRFHQKVQKHLERSLLRLLFVHLLPMPNSTNTLEQTNLTLNVYVNFVLRELSVGLVASLYLFRRLTLDMI